MNLICANKCPIDVCNMNFVYKNIPLCIFLCFCFIIILSHKRKYEINPFINLSIIFSNYNKNKHNFIN